MKRLLAVSSSVVLLLAAAPLLAEAQTKQQTRSKQPPAGRVERLSNPLNDLLDEAQKDIDRNDFEAAIAPLQKFIAEKPDVAYAHFQLAYAFTALKRGDEAKAEYEKTIALEPKMAEAHLNLGMLLAESDPAGAVAPLRKAVELLPSQSRPRYLLGVALEKTGDIKGAAEAYEGAIHLDPGDADTETHLGQIYLRQKKPKAAEEKFRAALASQPKLAPALLGLAESLDAQNSPDTAEAFRNYIATQPDNPSARLWLAKHFLDKQQYDQALAELDRADAGGPPSLESLKMRADILVGQKNWRDAAATLEKAVAITPNDAHLRGGLGRVYLQLKEYPAAERELKAALRLDGQNLVYWKDLSSTFFLEGNYPATLAALDQIAKVQQPGPGEWFVRALCYDHLNQTEAALVAYQRFLELDLNKNADQVWQAQQRIKILQRMKGRK